MIELGAGTGFVGLAFAQLFTKSKVTLTEMSEGCLNLMQKSISLNDLGQRVSTMPFKWGKEEAS